MKFYKNILWAVLLTVAALWVTPDIVLAAPLVTSGAHSVPILHWGWMASILGGLVAGTVTLEEKMEGLGKELKSWFDKATEEQKLRGEADKKTAETISALQTQLDAIDKKMVTKLADSAPEKTVIEQLQESEDGQRLFKNKKGHAIFRLEGKNASSIWERKATLTDSGVGTLTPGVIPAERLPGIVLEARRALSVRNVLSARPTALPLIYWAKVNAALASASPMMQNEGLVKHLNSVTFTTANSPVKTIATTIKASKQILDDWQELGGFLQTGLGYYANRQEETQLLSGDNTGDNLNGLITQATAFDSTLLTASAGYTFIDVIGAAIQQIGSADELPPTFLILNTRDYWKIRRTKDSYGRYILGDPSMLGSPDVWGLTPVPTNSIAAGTFLVGSGDPAAAEIRDRMELQVEISTEDEDNFRRNLVTIRAEKRMVLTVFRPASYITGTFISSPANP